MKKARLIFATTLAAVGAFLGGARPAFAFEAAAGAREPAPDKKWTVWARLPEALTETMVVELNGAAYFLGGIGSSGQPTGQVKKLDLRARSWSAHAPMPQVVTAPAVAVLDGLIYVAGGCDRADLNRPAAGAFVFNPAAELWESLPPLPERLCGANGASLSGQFFVFGGTTGGVETSALSDRVYAYDPRARSWSRKRDMPLKRFSPVGAELDGRFLIAGGCSSMVAGVCATVEASVDAYDPGVDSWSMAPALPGPLYGGGAVSTGGKVIVAGGRTQQPSAHQAKLFESSYMIAKASVLWSVGPGLIRPRWQPQLFPLPKGVAAFGPSASNNPEDTIEALGSSAPFVEIHSQESPVAAAPRSPERVLPRTPSADVSAAPGSDVDALPLAVAPHPHSYAVVIGIERYREALPRADFADSDARLTAQYFKRVLGVSDENLAMLTDDRATKSDFEKYFERWLPNRVEAGDEVYVYFSGHGAPHPQTGESYLVPFDADPTYIEQTGYSIKRLYAQLSKLPAKRVLVVMDSCFSGAGGRSVIAKGARPLVVVKGSAVPRPLTVITASSGEQISNSYQEKRHGLMTYLFLKGLREKGANFRAVYDFLEPQVERVARRDYNSSQNPQWMKGD
ncbi:MAG: caspase family protein [Elusimicrobiota bacterium]